MASSIDLCINRQKLYVGCLEVFRSMTGVVRTGRLPKGITAGYQPMSPGQFLNKKTVHTTNIKPRSFTVVHFKVYRSFLYGGLRAAEASSAMLAPGRTFSSMKTSWMSPLMILALTGAYERDHNTTPEVVRISKLSSILLQVEKCYNPSWRNVTLLQGLLYRRSGILP